MSVCFLNGELECARFVIISEFFIGFEKEKKRKKTNIQSL